MALLLTEEDIQKETPNGKLYGFFQYEMERYPKASPYDIPEVLYRLKHNEVSRAGLITLLTVRYQIAHFFEDMLRHMIRVVDKGLYGNNCKLDNNAIHTLREAALQNLKEELGEMESYGGPHQEGREIILTALGLNYGEWKAKLGSYQYPGDIHPAVATFLGELKKIIEHGGVEAIACLWYYENRISLDGKEGDYCILLSAFEHQFPEFKKEDYKEGDVLWHIASHAEHDVYHAELAQHALTINSCYAWVEAVDYGVRETRTALDWFWEKVGYELGFKEFSKFHTPVYV